MDMGCKSPDTSIHPLSPSIVSSFTISLLLPSLPLSLTHSQIILIPLWLLYCAFISGLIVLGVITLLAYILGENQQEMEDRKLPDILFFVCSAFFSISIIIFMVWYKAFGINLVDEWMDGWKDGWMEGWVD